MSSRKVASSRIGSRREVSRSALRSQKLLKGALRSGKFGEVSPQQSPPLLQRSSQKESHKFVTRRLSTACKEEYDMWLLPLHEFVGLSELRPHQHLLRENRLARWDPSMTHVFFVSHQWTSFDHPDHTGGQLRAMQKVLLRFMSGRHADTELDFKSRALMGTIEAKRTAVTGAEWQRMLNEDNVFIWLDFCSIPQVGRYHDGDDERARSDLVKAVNSIPAYIERVTHFFALCPTIHHKDISGAVCDYGSWLSRGWCNLELYALMLARFGDLPAIVVKGGGEFAPHMLSPLVSASRTPGLGELTCCTRNHKIMGVDGVERDIPCDRAKIGAVLATMLSKRQKFHLGRKELSAYRTWKAAAQMIVGRLSEASELESMTRPRGLREFLLMYQFNEQQISSVAKYVGLSPMHLAAWTANTTVLHALIEQNVGGGVRARVAKAHGTFGFATQGMTPLHMVVMGSRANQAELEATIKLLLAHGADPNAKDVNGATPLMGAANFLHADGIRALLKCAESAIDLEHGVGFNHTTVLGIAAYTSSEEVVKILLAAGASRTHVHNGGGSKVLDAIQNPTSTSQMLEIIWKGLRSSPGVELDLNYVRRSKTIKWHLIYRLFECGIKTGWLSKSVFALDMAHMRGSTALHLAALQGKVQHVQWLLNHGAHKSLHVCNAMGATPLDLAHIFGPHLEVELALASAMLASQHAHKHHMDSHALPTS